MADGVSRRSWLASNPRTAPLLVFFLAAAITLISVVALERTERSRDRIAATRTADAITASLIRRAATTGAYLRAGSALFGTAGAVTPDMFNRFASELRLDQNFRGAEGIGWAPAISPLAAASFEAEASAILGRPVRIQPAPDASTRPLLVPIFFLQPDTPRNRLAIGYDMYADTARREAMREAVRLRQPVATAPIVLVQEGGGTAPGFNIYMPVFSDSRERQLRGFIYSPFRSQDLLASTAPADLATEHYAVTLHDVGPASGQSAGERRLIATLGEAGASRGHSVTSQLQIANRLYQLTVTNRARPLLSRLSLLALVVGLSVAGLMMLLVRLLSRQAEQDQQRLAWFQEQSSIRDTLTRELNHRVKNTLANVLSIIALTRRRAASLEEFAEGLDGRIRALSATHDLLTKSEWSTTPLEAVVCAEMAPYMRGREQAVTISGPPVELAPNDALSLGMALHELTTNAAKYGALSEPGGQVDIRWEHEGDKLVRIQWEEHGGPPVPQQRTRGFGTDLVEKIVAHELRHPVNLRFEPDGVRCTLLVPVRQPSPFALRAATRQTAAA
ncbi:histidine kinase [Erythrobacteraceae bacterium CFH 75059]|uniref:CHASE domain-containing protein n=1 Tax=Qipengyuania thermophila TaxID=2509361 RepID=UPI001021111E|nr:CHASE domain-containing protein [Qipengyuania thermophila]TCD06794.1 histidine kinase [Erythrobacteraceae bacterium CFH 75059]